MSVLDFKDCNTIKDIFDEVERVYHVDEALPTYHRVIIENGIRSAVIMIKPKRRE